MTVYLGSQNVGVGMVEMIPADVKNEDIIITENGVYNAGEGYTGLGTVTVDVESSGGGEIIEVLNKTGSVINQGDKVWLSENYQGDVSRYVWLEQSRDFAACIDRTGTFGVTGSKGYNIGDTEATFAYNVTGGNPKVLVYGDDNSIITNAGTSGKLYRIDGQAQYTISINSSMYLCSKYLAAYKTLKELNMLTGETVKSWSLSTGITSAVVIDNTVYTFSNNYYFDLPEESGAITLSTHPSIVNNTGTYKFPLGVTSDNKYIVMANGSMDGTSLSGVTFFEVLGKGQLKELSAGELPTDLQPFYSVSCYVTFNPYTGILTACAKDGTEYVVMKYENGEWTKVAVDLTLFSGCTFLGPITLSDDLTRASVMQRYSSAYYASIYNFPTSEGYSAIAYNTRNITDKTITATALAESQPNELTQVQIGSVTNEDLIVTENGTYTPSATYTGFGSVTVNIETKPSEENVGDEIEVINNTGKTIEAGDKVWVNILSNGIMNKENYIDGIGDCTTGFTKDGQYIFVGNRLYKVNNDNSITWLKTYENNNEYRIKQFNGRTYATSLNFTVCINYPNNWNIDWTLINDGYFINYYSGNIRKYDLETGALIKEYTGNADQYDDGEMVVIDNVMYRLNYKKRKYIFNDDDNTYSYYDYAATVNGGGVGYILGKTSDGKYFVDNNLNLIKYLGNDTFEVVAYEKMPAILQRWNGIEKKVSFNQDTGVLVVDGGSEYGIYRYDNGEWKKLNYELDRSTTHIYRKSLAINYDLTKYSFVAQVDAWNAGDTLNIGTMQPNLKVMAQEFKWFNVNEQSITGIAKESAEPDQTFKVSTILESKIDVTVTTNADNAEISME